MEAKTDHAMCRVDHYDQSHVLQPDGKTLTALTPVFEADEADDAE